VKFLKRKSEGKRGEMENEKIEKVFRRCKKTIRSPVKMGEDGGMKEIFKEMREEIKEGELKKELRKELRKK